MRVISGTARRLRLVTPEGDETRPTQDRIKETLFNMIQNEVPGAVFVDICAGSGGIGIEALSRGAVRAYFIENSIRPYKCLVENLHTTRLEDRATVLRSDVLVALRSIRESAVDLIYFDPPYASGLYEPVLALLSALPYVTMETTLIVESEDDMDFSFAEDLGFEILREKSYKHNKHIFLHKKGASA